MLKHIRRMDNNFHIEEVVVADKVDVVEDVMVAKIFTVVGEIGVT